MDASRAAGLERLIEQRHGVPIGCAASGHDVGDGHGGERAEFFFHAAAGLFGLRRLGGIGEWGRGGGGGGKEKIFWGGGGRFGGGGDGEQEESGCWGVWGFLKKLAVV